MVRKNIQMRQQAYQQTLGTENPLALNQADTESRGDSESDKTDPDFYIQYSIEEETTYDEDDYEDEERQYSKPGSDKTKNSVYLN